MSCRPRQQSGATLLVVLSLLAIASVMALGALQSALVDERLAGNLVAMSRAQLAAEWGAGQWLDTGRNAAVKQDFDGLNVKRHDATRGPACDQVSVERWDDSDDGLQSHRVQLSSRPRVGYFHGNCQLDGQPGHWVIGWVSNGEFLIARHLILLAPKPRPDGATASAATSSTEWIDGGLAD